MLLKQEASFGKTGIDSVAGPSEVLLICDKSMPKKIAAIDLLAQAEHDENAQSILVTNDKDYALEVEKEIENYLRIEKEKSRYNSWEISVLSYCSNFGKAIEVSNLVSPNICNSVLRMQKFI